MKEPFGYTVFCDDIRDEVSNKKTFVGVYLGELLTPSFPLVLPTFGLAISYLEPIEWPVDRVQIKVLIPGQEDGDEAIIDADITSDRPASPFGNEPSLPGRLRAHHMHFRLSPVVIFKEGLIKVRAYLPSREVRLGSLNVRLVRDSERVELGWQVDSELP